MKQVIRKLHNPSSKVESADFALLLSKSQRLSYRWRGAHTDRAAIGKDRVFGIEVEFDFPASMERQARRRALRNIGSTLHDAGLVKVLHQVDADKAHGAYAHSHRRGWVFKTDGSCAGEIASPMMRDDQETWRSLVRVLSTIRAHGGVANRRTGLHVHVSTPEFGSNSSEAHRLVTIMRNSFKEWVRLSSHPARGKHRGFLYCLPNLGMAVQASSEAEKTKSLFSARDVWLNFQHVSGFPNGHVEFRLWDGTLDPAVIQAQVGLSVAAVELAVSDWPLQEVHSRLPSELDPNPDKGFVSLMQALCQPAPMREQSEALWSATSWQLFEDLYSYPEAS